MNSILSSLQKWTNKKSKDGYVNFHQSRILGFDHVLRRLKARGNGSVFKDNVRGTKLVVLMEEDLEL